MWSDAFAWSDSYNFVEVADYFRANSYYEIAAVNLAEEISAVDWVEDE